MLPQLPHTLLEYTIQHTTYLWPCGLLSGLSRSVSGLSLRVPPLTIQTAYQPWAAKPRTCTLPFLIPVNWAGFVVRSAPPVTLHAPWFPCGPVDTCSFHNTCFTVTTTGLISDRTLTSLSRLVYMNHCWRSCVGLPPLAVSPQLFFASSWANHTLCRILNYP